MKKQKNLIILLIPILILTVAWVIFNVYHSYVNSTIDVPIAKNIKPIKGTFDTDTLEQLKTRVQVDSANDIIIKIEDDQESTSSGSLIIDETIDDLEIEDGTQSAELEEL